MTKEYDLVIIGGGSGGLVVASAAAQLKAKVVLVEKHRLGGDCLWYGCVPSKSLIHASRIAYQVQNSHNFGIYNDNLQIKFSEAINHVQQVISTIEPNDSPERFRGLGVDVIFGDGAFIDENTFQVNQKQFKPRNFVISTGSSPKIPDIQGLSEVGFITNEQVFSLTQLPKSIIIMGGGAIACELGQALRRLGAQITIIASRNQLLPKEDSEAAKIIENQLIEEGIRIIKSGKAEKVELIEGKKVVFVKGEKLIAEEILISIGRTPNLKSLNLEKAKVKYNNQGIEVNHKLQTSNKKIYGCGDVIGGYQFTHVAGYEATIILQNALFFPTKKVDYRVIPWATFTSPELARVGMNETQARKFYGDNIIILKQEIKEVDRAQTEGNIKGFSKIIVTLKGDILGATIIGESAGELIHEIVLAMKNNLKVTALTGIHIYPTLSEINSKTGLLFTKQKYAKNQGLQNLLSKFFSFRRWLGF
ncbi:FAD-dependent oxidoreductase [Geminocystis sp. GBBB08]|uniref:dihydrolipoyl dehydrogenase family protein n=1 Tax=Geminocystis sp. GBBB08 TaxID=2604140 RepID=UPI0027E34D87|nr:FAD-dependent oxidoreductase [Geminocystis sp. GBBB08]MBL1211200.1 NADPH-dependent L-lysine N(6)-monooxygenase [Geminocystis sp. GBBB08]